MKSIEMGRFLSRLLNRIFLCLFAAAFLTIIILSFSLTVIFEEQFLLIKNNIEKTAGEALGKKVSIESIYLLPYGEVLLCNINISDNEGTPYINLKRCQIRIKLLPLFINRTVVISGLTFVKPIFFPASKNLRIVLGKKQIPDKHKVRLDKRLIIKLKSGQAVFAEDYPVSTQDKIGFGFRAELKEAKMINSEGWVDFREYRFKDYLLNKIFFFDFIDKIRYKLKASLTADTLSVDELLLDLEQFKIEAKGLIKNYKAAPVLDLSLTLKELDFPEKIYLTSKLCISYIRNFIVHIKGALREPSWAVRLDNLRSKFSYLPALVKIDNFTCNLRYSQEGFFINKLSCFLNNFPVGLNGKITNFESPCIELNLISHPGQLPSLRPLNPLNFEFTFSGYKYKDSMEGKTYLEIEKLISARPRKVQYLKLTINDLLCQFLKRPASSASGVSPALSIEAKGVVGETNAPKVETRLELCNFKFSIYPECNRLGIPCLSLSGYKGFLKGNGYLIFDRFPPLAFLNFKFSGFNMTELSGLFHLDFELSGDLNGEAIYDNGSFSYLVGTAAITNGYIKNLKLLDLIANFLNIISLKDIHFEDFSSVFSFSVAGDRASLEQIKLCSKDIYLNTDLKFREKQKINGNMLIRLSTGLLKESFKLRMLLLLMGQKLPYVDFEFKIGGFVKTPHIKWEETKFKQGLMRFLSENDKKVMEKQIEEAIKPLIEIK